MMRHLIAILFLALMGRAALAGEIPDPKLTPGVVRSGVTVAQLCPVAHTARVRHVTLAMHKAVFAEYGIPYSQHAKYEDDHFIPLSLGGSNDNRNRWPEPLAGKYGAHTKDKLEDRLHREVCAGHITLHAAQDALTTDWRVAYRHYFGEP